MQAGAADAADCRTPLAPLHGDFRQRVTTARHATRPVTKAVRHAGVSGARLCRVECARSRRDEEFTHGTEAGRPISNEATEVSAHQRVPRSTGLLVASPAGQVRGAFIPEGR